MAAKRQIITPVIVPLLVAGLLIQAVVPLLRLSMTYQALHKGMDAATIGLLTAVFSLLPIFVSVPIGRFNDRGAPALAAVMGTIAVLVSGLWLWLAPITLPNLLGVTLVLGLGQTLCISSLQFIAMICSSRAHRDRVLGNYMVAMSLGQAIGPLLIGFPNLVYPLCLCAAVVSVVAGLMLVWSVPQRPNSAAVAAVSLVGIARTRGLPWIIVTGSLCVTALDLMLAFMPLLGEARGLAPATVGLMLSVRAAAAMLSRVLFSQFVRRLGRMRLMLVSVALAGAGLTLLALPLPVVPMGVAMGVTGFGLGLALTSSIALVMQIAPVAVRGTALSLRLTANRIAQFGLPLIAAVAIAPFGVAGIFGITGIALLLTPFARPRALLLSH